MNLNIVKHFIRPRTMQLSTFTHRDAFKTRKESLEEMYIRKKDEEHIKKLRKELHKREREYKEKWKRDHFDEQ